MTEDAPARNRPSELRSLGGDAATSGRPVHPMLGSIVGGSRAVASIDQLVVSGSSVLSANTPALRMSWVRACVEVPGGDA